MRKLKHLDLFSGIGGFALGLKWAGCFETVGFCEIDPYCQKVIAKNFPGIPIYNDVRTLEYDGPVDIITGGYPCQPFSVTGKRKGAEDDRHLWPAMFDLIKKHRPSWVIGENVAGHISMGLDTVLDDLGCEDYTVRTFVIPACAVGAGHRRDRTWIIANTTSIGDHQFNIAHKRENITGQDRTGGPDKQDTMARAGQSALVRFRHDLSHEPKMGRMVYGISRPVDRLKGLGNAVVPQIPEIIGHAIMAVEGMCDG